MFEVATWDVEMAVIGMTLGDTLDTLKATEEEQEMMRYIKDWKVNNKCLV